LQWNWNLFQSKRGSKSSNNKNENKDSERPNKKQKIPSKISVQLNEFIPIDCQLSGAPDVIGNFSHSNKTEIMLKIIQQNRELYDSNENREDQFENLTKQFQFKQKKEWKWMMENLQLFSNYNKKKKKK